MGLNKFLNNLFGIISVQIEGFFTERFINLCRINNVKIWDVRNIVKGVVRFKMNISDFKKLRPISKKTKCKVEIKEKKGLYFMLHKYRKRKLIFALIGLLVFFSISFSTFIWDIDVVGNTYVTNEQIITALHESGVYVGKSKIGLDKKKVINNFRVELQDITWAGLEIDGTKATIKVVEKTKIDEENIQNTKLGDIVADKSGIITKIVPENGTAKFKAGSYVEEGTVLIEGIMYSKVLEPKKVTAKGIINIDREYELNKEYNYEIINKEYAGKVRYTIGIGIDSKENMLNYLNKNKKYDITKSSKTIKIFGHEISFDLYKCSEYNEISVTRTKEELVNISNSDIENYLNNDILGQVKKGILKQKDTIITDTQNGITVNTKFTVNEEIGKFVERN